ncbi:DNA polymerase III subunit gamma/tau [Mucilaginibacter koreensis]
MDNFIVSARKYRPATFESVVGQQHVTNTLKNAIKSNQLAQAFLFCGPRGVGKTTCARILAKTINCTNLQPDGEACGVCPSCTAFQNGNSFNVHELDAASNNSVDDIRSLIEQVRIPPQGSRYKVYVIDEVHMLSQAAFNAFLKTLEEPPNYAIFILATTEKHKILPTILSRCQIFDFNRIKVDDMAAHLASIAQKENISFEPDGLHIIAQKADGGLRDALSMFDQIVSFSAGKVTYNAVIDNLNILDYDYYFNITDSLLREDTSKTLLLFNEILSKGFDGNHFITGLTGHLRNLLVVKDAATIKLLEVSENIKNRYLQQAQQSTISFLLSAMNVANQCDLNYRLSKNQRLQVELALLKICHLPSVFNAAVAPAATAGVEAPAAKKSDTQPVKAPATMAQQPAPIAALTEPAVAYQPQRPAATPAPAATVTELLKQTEPVKQPEPVKPVVADKPKIQIPKPTLGGASVKIPSLKDIGKFDSTAQADEDDPYIKGTDKQPFTPEQFMQRWNEYASQAKADGKATLHSIMTGHEPKMLKPYDFEVTLHNKSQELSLRDEKPDLLNFLRVQLKNFEINVIPHINEHAVAKRPYTSSERFQYLAAKNPGLIELKNKFNLEFD